MKQTAAVWFLFSDFVADGKEKKNFVGLLAYVTTKVAHLHQIKFSFQRIPDPSYFDRILMRLNFINLITNEYIQD